MTASARFTRGKAGAADPARFGVIAVPLLLLAAWGLGGSGRPWLEAALECAAALILAAWLCLPAAQTLGAPRRTAVGLAGLLLVVPALQLIPLPPTLWHALSGRELELRALALIDAEQTWQPFTIAPTRTLAALTAALPPALALLLVAALPLRARWVVPATVTVIGFASLIIGAGQMTRGADSAWRVYSPGSRWLQGLEVNHNSQGTLFLLAFLAWAAITRLAIDRGMRRWLVAVVYPAGAVLLAFGTALTASRTSIVLLGPAFAFALAIFWPTIRGRITLQRGLAAGAILAVTVLIVLKSNSTVGDAFARFDFAGEQRPEIWSDSFRAAIRHSPFGAGMGSFIPVFSPIEQPGSLHPFPIDHAHNEYLELAIEAGIPGLILLTGSIAMLIRSARKLAYESAWRSSGSILFGVGATVVVALHSLVDYPLRSMAVACILTACAGLLIGPRTRGDELSDIQRLEAA